MECDLIFQGPDLKFGGLIFISIKFVWPFYSSKISKISDYFWIILFFHESIRKSVSYVFTLSALVPRVYVLTYDYMYDIYSVLVHFYTSSTSVFSSNVFVSVYDITSNSS